MRQPPPFTQAGRFFVTGGLAAISITTTLLYWGGYDVSVLCSGMHLWRRPWEFFTSALPHAAVLHLLFNIYWLWVFGTIVEQTFGHWRTALFYIAVGMLSAAAQYAFSGAGIGLSGIGYGLFGLLWVLSRRDRRLAGVVDDQTISLFVVWFFLCIALTWGGVWNVANVAHGVGAIAGIGLGFAIVEQGARRRATVGAWVGAAATVLVLSSVGRPYVNFAPRQLAWETADDAYACLTHDDTQQSIQLFQSALARRPDEANWWYNLGVALSQAARWPEAADAFDRAAALKPDDAQHAKVASETRDYVNALRNKGAIPEDSE